MLGIYYKEKFSRITAGYLYYVIQIPRSISVGVGYANSLWNPYQKQDMKALDKVQMRATRLVTALRHKPYQERLKALDLPTLIKFRRSKR